MDSRDLTDYCTALCAHFLYSGSWDPGSDMANPGEYVNNLLVTINTNIWGDQSPNIVNMRIHLANYTLFVSGMLPAVVENFRLQDGPSVSFYEEVGRKGYALSASVTSGDMSNTLGLMSKNYTAIRTAMNSLSTSNFL